MFLFLAFSVVVLLHLLHNSIAVPHSAGRFTLSAAQSRDDVSRVKICNEMCALLWRGFMRRDGDASQSRPECAAHAMQSVDGTQHM